MTDAKGPNRGGRPRAVQPLETQVSTRLAPSDYDRLVKAANRRDQSVASYVRQIILVRLPPQPEP